MYILILGSGDRDVSMAPGMPIPTDRRHVKSVAHTRRPRHPTTFFHNSTALGLTASAQNR